MSEQDFGILLALVVAYTAIFDVIDLQPQVGSVRFLASFTYLFYLVFRVLLGTLALGLAGCAGFNNVESDVSTYSKWPAGRQPATYTFERLPSQQAREKEQDRLEAAARAAVESSGFKPATDPKSADVTVQLGALSLIHI